MIGKKFFSVLAIAATFSTTTSFIPTTKAQEIDAEEEEGGNQDLEIIQENDEATSALLFEDDIDVHEMYETVAQEYSPELADELVKMGLIDKSKGDERRLGVFTSFNNLWNVWKDGKITIPLTYNPTFSSGQVNTIRSAANDLANQVGTIQFVDRTNERDYIEFVDGGGCSSRVGRGGGRQSVTLKKSGCVSRGIVQHELLHAIGFWHEQSRGDRDDFVTINWDNIEDGKSHNFNKRSTASFLSPYDYGSVMHYSRTAFSKGGNTIDAPQSIGQRSRVSSEDIRQVRMLYPARRQLAADEHEIYILLGRAGVLSVGEIELFNALTGKKLSLSGGTQSTQYASFTPSRAYDGNPATFTHTQESVNPWISVIFKNPVNKPLPPMTLKITNRKDCCQSRLNNAQVYFDEKRVGTIRTSGDADQIFEFNIDGDRRRLKEDEHEIFIHSENIFLHPKEVELFDKASGEKLQLLDPRQSSTTINFGANRAIDGNRESYSRTASGPLEWWSAIVKINGPIPSMELRVRNRVQTTLGRRFEVRLSNNCLHLREIEIYNRNGNKLSTSIWSGVSMSSVYGSNRPATVGVDGNTGKDNYFHTQCGGTQWWRGTFSVSRNEYPLRVKVINRDGWSSRLANAEFFVDDSKVFQWIDGDREEDEFTLNSPPAYPEAQVYFDTKRVGLLPDADVDVKFDIAGETQQGFFAENEYEVLVMNDGWFHPNEIELIDLTTGEKIQLTDAQQLSTHGTYVASNAIDGDLDTIAHTRFDPREWWRAKATINGPLPQMKVRVYNLRWETIEYRDRMNGAMVYFAGTKVGTIDTTSSATQIFEFDVQGVRRPLKAGEHEIFLMNQGWLHPSEVEVFRADTGEKLTLFEPRQSSAHDNSRFPASAAIDGNLATISHTLNRAEEWWSAKVLIEDETLPALKIVVQNRQECCQDRMNGAKVFLDAREVGTIDTSSGNRYEFEIPAELTTEQINEIVSQPNLFLLAGLGAAFVGLGTATVVYRRRRQQSLDEKAVTAMRSFEERPEENQVAVNPLFDKA